MSLRFGLGKHNADVAPLERPLATKFAFLAAVIYIALSYLVKVVVGLFLVRICSGMLAQNLYNSQPITRLMSSFQPPIRSGSGLASGACL